MSEVTLVHCKVHRGNGRDGEERLYGIAPRGPDGVWITDEELDCAIGYSGDLAQSFHYLGVYKLLEVEGRLADFVKESFSRRSPARPGLAGDLSAVTFGSREYLGDERSRS